MAEEESKDTFSIINLADVIGSSFGAGIVGSDNRLDTFTDLLTQVAKDMSVDEILALIECAKEFDKQLLMLGLPEADMCKASDMFPKSVQYATSHFIDRALALRNTEEYKDLQLVDLAKAFCPNGEIRNDSPFKEGLLADLEEAKNDMERMKLKAPSAAKPHIDRKALTPTPKTLAIITDAYFGKLFYGDTKHGEGIFFIKNFNDLKLSNENKEISLETNGIGAGEMVKRLGLQPAMTGDVDLPLLRTFAKTALTVKTKNTDDVTTFYLPDFCNALGINLKRGSMDRAESRRQVLDKIKSFENLWGRLPNSTTISKVFNVYSVNIETEEIKIVMPFFNTVYNELKARRYNALEIEKKPFYMGTCDMLRSTVNKERDKEAVELAITLIKGITKRGTLSDDQLAEMNKRGAYNKYRTSTAKEIGDTVTYKITCKSLLNECDALKYVLAQTTARSNKLRKLQQAFKNMYTILKKHSLLYDYYVDLNITPMIPSMTTLDTYIVVTHRGKNQNYTIPFVDEPIDLEPDNVEE